MEQYTTESGRSPAPIPSRSATPGRNPSSTTSARAHNAGPRSGSRSRSHRTDSLPPLSAASQPGATERSGSPSGVSTRTTRAPRCSSSRLAYGPGRYRVKSTTRVPVSGCTMLSRLTERSTSQEDKRRLILDAAVRVFARKGYHTCRVGDIAEEAGVAHGLLYHYFRSKEELLETIFRETWRDVLDAVRSVEETDETARERLAGIAKILLRAWRRDPDLVRVLVREVTRSSHLQRRIDEIEQAFAGLERIIARGQEEGEFRADVDPRMVSYVFYGALEEILTGWVLGQLDDGDEQIALAEQTVIEVVCGGLVRDREAAPL